MDLRVKEICKEKGILFKDLAEKLGVTDVGLRKQVQGNPTIGTLEKIAVALCVDVMELFTKDGNSDPNTITCPKCGTRFRMEE